MAQSERAFITRSAKEQRTSKYVMGKIRESWKIFEFAHLLKSTRLVKIIGIWESGLSPKLNP